MNDLSALFNVFFNALWHFERSPLFAKISATIYPVLFFARKTKLICYLSLNFLLGFFQVLLPVFDSVLDSSYLLLISSKIENIF